MPACMLLLLLLTALLAGAQAADAEARAAALAQALRGKASELGGWWSNLPVSPGCPCNPEALAKRLHGRVRIRSQRRGGERAIALSAAPLLLPPSCHPQTHLHAASVASMCEETAPVLPAPVLPAPMLKKP